MVINIRKLKLLVGLPGSSKTVFSMLTSVGVTEYKAYYPINYNYNQYYLKSNPDPITRKDLIKNISQLEPNNIAIVVGGFFTNKDYLKFILELPQDFSFEFYYWEPDRVKCLYNILFNNNFKIAKNVIQYQKIEPFDKFTLSLASGQRISFYERKIVKFEPHYIFCKKYNIKNTITSEIYKCDLLQKFLIKYIHRILLHPFIELNNILNLLNVSKNDYKIIYKDIVQIKQPLSYNENKSPFYYEIDTSSLFNFLKKKNYLKNLLKDDRKWKN